MRWIYLFVAAAAITYLGSFIAAPAERAITHIQVADDPVARADLLVAETMTPQVLTTQLEAALKAEDDDLAESLIALAREHGIQVEPAQAQQLAVLKSHATRRALRDFADGFISGGRESGAALTGAISADVTGFGDLRDLANEGRKLVAGEPPDHLTVGLAAAGLALSVATWTSVGAAMPARGGVSLVKALQKTGRLSKPLAAVMTRTAATAIDGEALKLTMAAAGRLELTAARQAATQVLRPIAMTEFRQIGDSVATVYARAGQRGARDVLAIAQTPQELSHAARIAAAKGSKSRGIFALLGRGALMLGGLSVTLAGWLLVLVGWLATAAMLARKFGLMLGRLVWRRRKRPVVEDGRARLQPVRARPERSTAYVTPFGNAR